MNTLQKFEAKQLDKLQQNSKIPAFSAGDTVIVNVRVREGERERIQAYEGVERVFPIYSPRIESVELVRRGSVRRAKLYYLRDRRGKAARIAERTTGHGLEEAAAAAAQERETRKAAKKEAKAKKAAAKKDKA